MATKDLLENIGIKKIREEKLVPYSEETIRRYFRQGVLHAHETDADGISKLSARGSVRVRFSVFQKIARNNNRRLSIQDAGKIIQKAAGAEDEFILKRLESGQKVDEIVAAFLEKAESDLRRRER